MHTLHHWVTSMSCFDKNIIKFRCWFWSQFVKHLSRFEPFAQQVKPGSLGTVTRCRTLVNPPGVTWLDLGLMIVCFIFFWFLIVVIKWNWMLKSSNILKYLIWRNNVNQQKASQSNHVVTTSKWQLPVLVLFVCGLHSMIIDNHDISWHHVVVSVSFELFFSRSGWPWTTLWRLVYTWSLFLVKHLVPWPRCFDPFWLQHGMTLEWPRLGGHVLFNALQWISI